MRGVNWNAIHRTHLLTLGLVEMSHALRATIGIYDVNTFALGDGLIGAHRFTHITVDAFFSNCKRHDDSPSYFSKNGKMRASTNGLISPPKFNISLTRLEDTTPVSSMAGKNNVSISGCIKRFMLAN